MFMKCSPIMTSMGWDAGFIVVIFSCLSLILISLIIFQSSIAQGSQPYRTYENHDMGIKLSYPSGWYIPFEMGGKEECTKTLICGIFWASNESSSYKDVGLHISVFLPNDSYILEKCNCHTLMEFVKYRYKQSQLRLGKPDPTYSFINDNQTTEGKNILQFNSNIQVHVGIQTKIE